MNTWLLPLAWGYLCSVSVVSEGLGFRVDTNKRVDRFTADYIHGGYRTYLFPIGVLLALGRQSSLPVVRWLSILYIEVIRGLPLIGILFSGDAPTTTIYSLGSGATSDRRTYLI